jgi:RNA polymerase sigma-B factor
VPDIAATVAPTVDPARASEEAELFAALQRGEPNARERLVERFLPLARKLARRYHRGDEPLDDLVQVASLGLLKAIDRFEPGRGLAFSSFAVPTITGEVRRHFRDKTWSVRVPRGLQELTLDVDKAVTRLTTDSGRAPTVAELAEHLGRTDEEILEALQARGAYRTTSLETPFGDDDDAATLGESMGEVDGGYDRAEERATLGRLLGRLSERDREIIRMRFEEDMTQAQIAEVVGVSQMQVSRLIRQAIERMRAEARERKLS